MTSLAQTTFSAAFGTAPIWLQGGIAQAIGGYAPLNAILPGMNNIEVIAQYKPLAGSTLAKWQVAEYPLANFATAANAVVQQPLDVSMMMICPAQNNGGYVLKIAIFTALQALIQNHISSGGTFIVLTPAYVYNNCLLTTLRDISNPSEKQVQFIYQWDFTQPLITASASQNLLGTLMDKISNGLPTTTSWTQPPAPAIPNDINYYAD